MAHGKQRETAELASFPLVTEIPVHWGDQDAFGHVNNTVPLRWFESGRVTYLQQSGLGHLMNGGELAPMVVSTTCHYRRQIKFPDVMQIGIRVVSLRRSSFVMEQVAYNKNRGEVSVESSVVIVLFDYLAHALAVFHRRSRPPWSVSRARAGVRAAAVVSSPNKT